MIYEKELFNFINDEQIPYRTMFFHKGISSDEFTTNDFEETFQKFYTATRISFLDKKKNAFNLLFNLLWLDGKVNNFNWEYSSLIHYQKRLYVRYNALKKENPISVLSFLNNEKNSLSFLFSNLEKGQIAFLEDGGHWGLNNILCSLLLSESNLPEGWQNELKLILIESVSDKLKYIESLMNDETNRNLIFHPLEIGQDIKSKNVDNTNQIEKINSERNIPYESDDDLLEIFRQNKAGAIFFLYAIENFTTYVGKQNISPNVKYSNIYHFVIDEYFDNEPIPKQKELIDFINHREKTTFKRIYEHHKSQIYKRAMKNMHQSFKELDPNKLGN